jgi:para-nitrobenzyl esterase
MTPMMTLADGEDAGVKVAAALGAKSLADLRAVSAEQLQKDGRGTRPMIDGWYIKEDLSTTFSQGRQKDVDVLVGSNKDEGTFAFFGLGRGNAQQYVSQARERFGDLADAYLKLYPAGASDDDAHAAERNAFRDELSWQMRTWAALEARLGKSKTYVYYFTHEPPVAAGQPNRGASHTSEIPYVFNIPGRLWTDVDKSLAETMSSYWVNFAATGDPNGKGLPVWPQYRDKSSGRAMVLGDKVEVEAAPDTARIALYDSLFARQLNAKKTH